MSTYTDRRWEILIDDESFVSGEGGRQFKMTFEVLIDYGNFNTYADVIITNLTADTSAKAFKKGVKFTLRAGYADSIDTIFSGVIRNVFRRREGPNTITQIIARGGALEVDRPSINTALGKDCTITDIIQALALALDVPLDIDTSQFSDVPAYAGGYTLTGDPISYLSQLAETHQFSYLTENGRLIITRNGAYRNGTVTVISQATGMENIPIITEVGANVSVRLNPKLRIGGRFRIESISATFNFSNVYFQDVPDSAGKGEYRIFKLRHTGDTWGNSWTTDVTGYR